MAFVIVLAQCPQVMSLTLSVMAFTSRSAVVSDRAWWVLHPHMEKLRLALTMCRRCTFPSWEGQAPFSRIAAEVGERIKRRRTAIILQSQKGKTSYLLRC